MSAIEINKESVEELISLITAQEQDELLPVLEKLYPADIAELFDDFNLDQAVYIASLLEPQKKVDVLTELDDDVKLKFLAGYSNEEIANDFFVYIDSDDAADILNAMDTTQSKEILRTINDKEHSKNIASLLKFPENTAGALMAKELIRVKQSWTIKQCTDEIRIQAEDVSKVYTAYVVDEFEELLGWISLKKILLSRENQKVEDIYDSNIISESTYSSGEEVASTMQKYDLVALPIIDAFNRLVGRVTFDDVLDYVKDEAEKDYQMLSGISGGKDTSDTVLSNTRARLPWLIVGLVGGIASSLVIGGFEEELARNLQLALFVPLIMAMAGNVGVQSSSLMVQGLANNSITNSDVWGKLGKELLIALINGLVCSGLLMGYGFVSGSHLDIMMTVGLALLSVILMAAVIGTVVPLALDRLKIDPALATGPFITTSNDLLGLFLYFMIGNAFLG
ncbi:magnesium transporter [Bacteroidia bacterium]|jgi:magnesium transporter|nr:magnesium transporter [Bacteroidota bacterium]MDA9110707.1 magnesium transporter [Bacteroidia bacterium]